MARIGSRSRACKRAAGHARAIRELAHAVAIYGRKYAFVGTLLANGQGPEVLAGPLARARFYVLRPDWLRLTDNTVRFGYKFELKLNRTRQKNRPPK